MAELHEVKATEIELVKDWAVTLLRRSDHHAIAQCELAVAMPDEIVARRASIRDYRTEVEAAINGASDSDAVEGIMSATSKNWPTDG